MILSPEVYNKITAVVFTRQEPPVTTVLWAKPSDPEGTSFDFYVYDNGTWQPCSEYENIIIPEVDIHLSAFINDVGFYSIPTGGIPLSDLSEAVQTALEAAASAYQKPSTGIPSTDLSSAVQTSLGKADTAVQTETDPTVPSWAKQSSKPSYTASEVGALPDTTVIPDELKDLSDDATHRLVTDTEKATWNAKGSYSKPSGGIPKTDLASDVQTSLGKADTALQSFTETDPTVPSWAKQSSKPSYTASEVGAVPTTRKVNGKALSSDISLTASDVGALPDDTTIPTITFIQW